MIVRLYHLRMSCTKFKRGDRKMNILFVTGQFARNTRDRSLGGMALSVFKGAKGMQDRGHQVCILTVDSMDKEWNYQGIPVVSVGTYYDNKDKYSIKFLLDVLKRECIIEKRINKLRDKWPIDIIQYTGWFGIGLLHYNRIPAIMRISTYTKAELKNEFSKSRYRLLSKLELLAAKRMNFVFGPGRNVAFEVEKDLGRKVGIIETPYVPEPVEGNVPVCARKIKDKRYILFFGRLSIEKGIYVIDEIIYRILKRYPDLYFVFAGLITVNQGERIDERLRRSAAEFKERVVFSGVVPRGELTYLIQNADFIIMPSILDNFPNTCPEAMEEGKLVIGTDGSSLEQFIIDGKNGLLAKPNDAESLYQKILQAMNMDRNEKIKIEANAKERVKKWNIEDYSTRMERLYERIIILCQ